MYTIKAKEIYTEDGILHEGTVVTNGDIISELGGTNGEVIDLSAYKLLPGFLDIHVHGGNGFDTMDATYEALNEISKFKAKEGVTSFCPSTVTTSIEKTKEAIKNVDEAVDKGVEGAKIIGAFWKALIYAKNTRARIQRLSYGRLIWMR